MRSDKLYNMQVQPCCRCSNSSYAVSYHTDPLSLNCASAPCLLLHSVYISLCANLTYMLLVGFRLDAPVFSALFNSFDVSRKRQIGLPEYIAMTLFLQSATATFRAFDPQQQGQITLTFDQVAYFFICCSLSSCTCCGLDEALRHSKICFPSLCVCQLDFFLCLLTRLCTDAVDLCRQQRDVDKLSTVHLLALPQHGFNFVRVAVGYTIWHDPFGFP